MKQNDSLRYSRMSDIIQIVIKMQGTREGLTLTDIAKELNATRRTAERVKNAILCNFPQIDELEIDGRFKRWGFTNWHGRNEFISGIIGFLPEEILELEKLKKQAIRNGQEQNAKILKEIIDKINALMRDSRDNSYDAEENIKTLLELEGYAISQFSKEKLDFNTLNTIRKSLKTNKMLSFKYTKRNGENTVRKVAPYGLLYNLKSYLIAKDGIVKLFDLSNMEDITLEGESFQPDKDFNLENFASRSFGIYQEEPMQIKLLFDKEASKDAKNYYFHPTQIVKENQYGTVQVEFYAGGTKAMCWEFFKWGEHIKILEPLSLRYLYLEELQKILNNSQKTG
ncbi:MAG: WYL domain-containing protein [Candidatus Gastranaerophilales bacterium]|nr:WYL domain-containing protein [Candidatus Gastranaerophilales bacterium]